MSSVGMVWLSLPLLLVEFVAVHIDTQLIQQILSVIVVESLVVEPFAIERQTEVGYLQMPIGRNEEIVWFDIPVDPSHAMSFLDTENHFGNVPSGRVNGEDVLSNQQ